jgi:hypothetical protein
MSQGNLQSPADPTADYCHLAAAWDVESQLQRTLQWEADGTQLLRPADFHAWTAASWPTPQYSASSLRVSTVQVSTVQSEVGSARQVSIRVTRRH